MILLNNSTELTFKGFPRSIAKQVLLNSIYPLANQIIAEDIFFLVNGYHCLDKINIMQQQTSNIYVATPHDHLYMAYISLK
jgi:hypothetical protein